MSETQFTFEPLIKATRNTGSRTSSYPFDAMPEPTAEGHYATWYSPVGEDTVKKVQSAVGAINRKYSEETGEIKISTKTGKKRPVLGPIRKYSVTVRYVPKEAEEFAGEPYAIVQRIK